MASFSGLERFHSKINTKTEEFRKNHEEMLKLVEELQERLQTSLNQGPAHALEKHLRAGKLLARDRIELVLDEDSPFLELMPLAGWDQKDATIGGSIVAGIGLVSGFECLISASVPTMKGGAMNHVSIEKSQRLAEIALENRLPILSMIQSGGADLTQQSRVFHLGGRMFRDIAMRSRMGIPTITIVFGSSTAGGAYSPGMSDYVIMVKNQAQVFLGGPPLVRMAIGEVVDAETLGGADMHSRISGVSDYLAEDEYHALKLAREILHSIQPKKLGTLPREHFSQVEPPYYDIEELLGIVSSSVRIPFDVREVIARLVDGSRFSEFKPLYGPTLVTCHARLYGIPIGILGNNGVLFSEAANKGSQFIHLCNQSNIPLLFLQNITGFMVGKKSEQAGIIKHGAHMINAVSNSGVPAITIVMGASFGAGNYAMCGRSYRPRFLFSWPGSKCAVMGAEQLSGVLDTVAREAHGRMKANINQEELESLVRIRRAQNERESDVYYTSSRMFDDGIIDPRETRVLLGICLSVIYGSEVKGSNFHGVSRY